VTPIEATHDADGFGGAAIALIARAAADPKSPLRWPVLVTGGADGPGGRVVVLRQFNQRAREAVIYTDVRTGKVADIRADDRAALIFHQEWPNLQIRAGGIASLHHGDDIAAKHWERARRGRTRDYESLAAPGAPISSPEAAEYDEGQGAENFAVIRVTISELDVLLLGREAHRRARFTWTGARWGGRWVVP